MSVDGAGQQRGARTKRLVCVSRISFAHNCWRLPTIWRQLTDQKSQCLLWQWLFYGHGIPTKSPQRCR